MNSWWLAKLWALIWGNPLLLSFENPKEGVCVSSEHWRRSLQSRRLIFDKILEQKAAFWWKWQGHATTLLRISKCAVRNDFRLKSDHRLARSGRFDHLFPTEMHSIQLEPFVTKAICNQQVFAFLVHSLSHFAIQSNIINMVLLRLFFLQQQ